MNLFQKDEIKKALRRASKRLSSDHNDSFYVVDRYLSHSHRFLSILSRQQSIENTQLIKEAKSLSKSGSHSKEVKDRLKEIIHERTLSSRDTFRKFIALSRHSSSRA